MWFLFTRARLEPLPRASVVIRVAGDESRFSVS
jgi:hypothetical protein